MTALRRRTTLSLFISLCLSLPQTTSISLRFTLSFSFSKCSGIFRMNPTYPSASQWIRPRQKSARFEHNIFYIIYKVYNMRIYPCVPYPFFTHTCRHQTKICHRRDFRCHGRAWLANRQHNSCADCTVFYTDRVSYVLSFALWIFAFKYVSVRCS